ncbi:MAG: DUF2061 domain-containing protein [Pseudomonadota bacterium]
MENLAFHESDAPALEAGGDGVLLEESRLRSFIKALSWRVIGTLDTFFLSFLTMKFLGPLFGLTDQTSNLDIAQTAGLIAITEVVTKIILYTAHERFWNLIGWGVRLLNSQRHETRLRSIAKMSLWRVLASLDTMILALIFTGNLATAASIGGLEIITKLVLYFLHERAWLKISYGTKTS